MNLLIADAGRRLPPFRKFMRVIVNEIFIADPITATTLGAVEVVENSRQTERLSAN